MQIRMDFRWSFMSRPEGTEALECLEFIYRIHGGEMFVDRRTKYTYIIKIHLLNSEKCKIFPVVLLGFL